MVQIIENWALLTCFLQAISVEASATALTCHVEAVEPVGSFKNLLERHIGKDIVVRLKADASALQPGMRLKLKVSQSDLATFWGDAVSLEVVRDN